jgi:hypothetical protein
MSTQIFDRSEPDRPKPKKPMGFWSTICLAMFIVVGVPTLAIHVTFGPILIYSPPIRGRVIDESTGQPLSDAVVVGLWIADGRTYGTIHASETITGRDGSYELPGMSLRFRPLWRYFKFRDPELWMYKPGYWPARLNNAELGKFGWRSGRQPWTMNPRLRCYWDGKTVPLRPVDDVRAQGKAFEAVLADVIYAPKRTLRPQAYPLVWAAVLEGARRVPKSEYSKSYGDPRRIYDSMRKRK